MEGEWPRMIGRVEFELENGIIMPDADYGMLLIDYDAPPPKARQYTVKLDGMDGTLDMSEWAGRVLFDNRTVTVNLRDMNEQYADLNTRLLGRKAKIYFFDEPDYYYEGRCTAIDRKTRKHVTDLKITFDCQPYKMLCTQTSISQTVSSGLSIRLYAKRMPVCPEITLTAACALTYDGATYNLAAGTHTVAGIVITDTPREMGVSGSGTIKIQWRDGEL